MNLKSLKKEVASNIYRQGEVFLKLNTIRELEEQESNHFIAFVDERDESYDVSINIDEKFEIVSSSCDCGSSDPFCGHRVAVALHLKDRGKSSSTSVAKKIKARKVDPARQFIDDIPVDQLRQWLFDLTKTNKEFYQLLKVKFEKRIISLEWSDIENVHKDNIKAILKTAKYYDAAQLVKILGLLNNYHQELIEEVFLKEVIDFNLLENLFQYLTEFQDRARKRGDRLEKYTNGLKEIVQHRIIEADQYKITASIEQYLNNIALDQTSSLFLLSTLLEKYLNFGNLVNTDIINKIITTANTLSLTHIKKILIESLEKNNLLQDYVFKFKTEKYSSELNATIINALIKYNYLKEAERMADDCVKNSFGFSYYEIRLLLIKIYELTNQTEKKIEQLEFTSMVDFKYEGYKFLEENMSMVNFLDFKKRFNRMLGQHKGAIVYARFYISKYAEEQDWKGLLELVDIDYPFYLYEPYFPQLLVYDRMGLLRKLLNMNYSYNRKMTVQDNASWERILLDAYTLDEVKSVVNAKNFYGFGVKEKVSKLYKLQD
jgi:hypothetical protein